MHEQAKSKVFSKLNDYTDTTILGSKFPTNENDSGFDISEKKSYGSFFSCLRERTETEVENSTYEHVSNFYNTERLSGKEYVQSLK